MVVGISAMMVTTMQARRRMLERDGDAADEAADEAGDDELCSSWRDGPGAAVLVHLYGAWKDQPNSDDIKQYHGTAA